MSSQLIWAVVLLVLGLGILWAEIFIPSGGVLGLLGATALVASVLLAFSHGFEMGVIFFGVVSVALPVIFVVGMHLWPRTPVGRWLALKPLRDDEAVEDRPPPGLEGLVGRVGRTITPLRPSGLTDFDGRRIDTLAEGFLIEPGTLVRVVSVRGNRVTVRPVEPGALDA